MYKHIDLLTRSPEVSHEDLVETWRQVYLPALRELPGLVACQQVLPTEPAHAEFDGLSELFFETRADMEAALEGGTADPTATDGFPVAERRTFRGEVTVQRDDVDGDPDGCYKHSAFLVRQEGMSHEAFVDYWQTNHTPIARDIEGVVKYDTVIADDPASEAFDGVAELYFADLEDLYAALGSEGSRDYDPTKEVAKRAREDVDNFLAIDRRPRLIGQTHLVVGEA